MPRRYDAVFCDLGSTLVEQSRAFEDAVVDVLVPLGFGGGPEGIASALAARTAGLAAPEPGVPEPEDEHHAMWTAIYGGVLDDIEFTGERDEGVAAMWRAWDALWTPYPEVARTLDELCSRGYALAIVSNWAPDIARTCVRAGLVQCSVVIASANLGYAKPDPRIFHAALERTGVRASRAVHVGDKYEKDVLGARAAGIDAVLLRRPGGAEDVSAEPYQPTIASLDALLDLLD